MARIFKTAGFAKSAGKALILDRELCEAIAQVKLGQADDLGGGVFKKRLDKNRHRSIILAKGDGLWVYEVLFAKKDQANIDSADLARFRKLAKAYQMLTDHQIYNLIEDKDWMEICDDQA